MKQALVGGHGGPSLSAPVRLRVSPGFGWRYRELQQCLWLLGESRAGVILGPESRVLRQSDSTRVVKTPPPFVASPLRGLLRVSLGWVPTLHAGSAGGGGPPFPCRPFYGGVHKRERPRTIGNTYFTIESTSLIPKTAPPTPQGHLPTWFAKLDLTRG